MASSDIEARVRRLVEVGIGGGDLSAIEELIDPACVEHQRGHEPGPAGTKRLSADLHRRLSNLEIRVEDSALAGDRVWLRSRARGISTGAFLGFPPTGSAVEIDVFDVVRIEHARVVEHWGLADQLGLLLQLGFDPATVATGVR